jgi:uncharacterized protein (DUF1810 family)
MRLSENATREHVCMSEVNRTLERFVEAQRPVYDDVLRELRSGRKSSHWMWFIFPQLAGLAHSEMSRTYAIRNAAEAQAYVAHPVLGPRLVECCEILLALEGTTASDIFGSPDDLKLRSSMTLFASSSPPGSVFARVLDRYYDGAPDQKTLQLLEAENQ